MQARQKGFTLIELMITVAIVGILAAIAYPSYQEYVLRGNRAEGMAMLSDAAARQERYFSQNNTYADTVEDLGMDEDSSHDLYRLSIADATTTTYSLTATAIGIQAGDSKCGNLGLDQAGEKSASGSEDASYCWR